MCKCAEHVTSQHLNKEENSYSFGFPLSLHIYHIYAQLYILYCVWQEVVTLSCCYALPGAQLWTFWHFNFSLKMLFKYCVFCAWVCISCQGKWGVLCWWSGIYWFGIAFLKLITFHFAGQSGDHYILLQEVAYIYIFFFNFIHLCIFCYVKQAPNIHNKIKSHQSKTVWKDSECLWEDRWKIP